MTDILSDPRLDGELRRLNERAYFIADLNHPMTVGEKIGGGGKPGSREPGRQQCAWASKQLLDLLKRANASAEEIIAQANPREHRHIVVSVGGIPIEEAREQVRQQRTEARVIKHITVKYGKVVCSSGE